MADLRIGKTLQGRYKILSPLAEGGMGVVYKAERVGIGRPVVVKFLHAVLSDQPGIVDRFEREARATALLNHPNCVDLIDYGIEDGSPYLVMEYVEGKTLADLLDFGALEPRRAVQIARQVLAGLSHAHERGILHRDLKPANIMVIDAVGHQDFVKILDFGLAKLLGNVDGGKRDVTVQGIAIGTPGYMSPEQAAGVPSDRRSDIYCTGALLYHLVTGAKAFEGDDIHSVLRKHREETPMAPREIKGAANVSKDLEKAIARAMLREPSKRFQSAEEMMDALGATPEARSGLIDTTKPRDDRGRAGSPSSQDAITRAEQPVSRRARKSRSWLGAALGGGVVLGAGLTVALAIYTPITKLLPRPPQAAAPPAPAPVAAAAQPAEPPPAPAPPVVFSPHEITREPERDEPAPTPPVASAQPPTSDPAVDDEEDEVKARAEDGSGEDDGAPPDEVPAAPQREVAVKTVAEARALVRKGDPDGALAGLYRLRRQKGYQSGARAAEVATLIGHIYFERKWWTDALKEYRYACRQNPRAKNDAILVHNTVRMMGDRGTYWRARRLILDYIGRSAYPSLRAAARTGATPDLRRRSQVVLEVLEKTTRRAKR